MIKTLTSLTPIPPASATSSRRSFCRATLRPAAPPSSLYEVLRVTNTASRGEIKAAYRGLAKVYHPDSSRSDGQNFIEICEAYSTLSDPTARAMYDLTLAVGSGRRAVGISAGFYRRWETDQCW